MIRLSFVTALCLFLAVPGLAQQAPSPETLLGEAVVMLHRAMAAGVTDTLRDMEWIVGLIDARAPKPGPRGPYKKNDLNLIRKVFSN